MPEGVAAVAGAQVAARATRCSLLCMVCAISMLALVTIECASYIRWAPVSRRRAAHPGGRGGRPWPEDAGDNVDGDAVREARDTGEVRLARRGRRRPTTVPEKKYPRTLSPRGSARGRSARPPTARVPRGAARQTRRCRGGRRRRGWWRARRPDGSPRRRRCRRHFDKQMWSLLSIRSGKLLEKPVSKQVLRTWFCNSCIRTEFKEFC